MSNNVETAKFSKRLIIATIWALIVILAAAYLAVELGDIAPLLVIAAIVPLLVLLVQKLEMMSQRLLRDTSYIKGKTFKAVTQSEKILKEVKANRSQTKITSARNQKLVQKMNKFKKDFDKSFSEVQDGIESKFSGPEYESLLSIAQTEVAETTSLRNEWQEFLKSYSRITHFNALNHSFLTPIQQSEISQILEAYETSDVLLIGLDNLSTYDRSLNQVQVSFPLQIKTSAPLDSSPFIVVAEFEEVRELRKELGTELATLNAAFVVPSPMSTFQLNEVEFSRIPTTLSLTSIEFICPNEILGEIERIEY